ncbi:cysteine proteinase [Melanomma pulvis-pyrius CBS 109.77]|uniref:ubiquitinyl hydrolase 1 n=1 Tax=Melanomma pulvis-pyrius CBS 109.77 TaxID=1314802 RepID=A0A6A6XE36_9PLEO|nr:cysteine proteinase [Melanomma pulvis-pyrius CBS 109.77]
MAPPASTTTVSVETYIQATREQIATAKKSTLHKVVVEALEVADATLERLIAHNKKIAPANSALKKKSASLEKDLKVAKDKNCELEERVKHVEQRNSSLQKALDEAKTLLGPYKMELNKLRETVKRFEGAKQGGKKPERTVGSGLAPIQRGSTRVTQSGSEDSIRNGNAISTLIQSIEQDHNPKRKRDEEEIVAKEENTQAKKAKIEHQLPPHHHGKFAHNPQAHPSHLQNETRSLSHSNSVLQGLSTTTNAFKLSKERGVDTPCAIRSENSPTPKQVEATKAFIDLIVDMQQYHHKSLDPSRFQSLFAKARNHNLDGKREEDAASYLEQLLSCLDCESIEDTYKLYHHFRGNCPNKNCGSNISVDSDEDGHILSLNKPAPWLVPIRSGGGRAGPSSHTNLRKLLHEKLFEVQTPLCQRCKLHKIQRVWKGLHSAPKTMIMKFERSGLDGSKEGFDYALDLPNSIDMKDYLPTSTRKTRYSLSTVIKHRGPSMDSGYYVAYSKTDDGLWWRCNDRGVERVTEKDFQGHRGGDTANSSQPTLFCIIPTYRGGYHLRYNSDYHSWQVPHEFVPHMARRPNSVTITILILFGVLRIFSFLCNSKRSCASVLEAHSNNSSHLDY